MSCHFQRGSKKNVAFVFSCPGKNEKKAGYPAAKATGTNLKSLLVKLTEELNRNDLSREEITITNSWDKVEFEGDGGTGRSEAGDFEIVEVVNITRLNEELKNITDFIVCCGDKAKMAVSKCKLKYGIKTIQIKHLGNKSVNSIKIDLKGNKIQSSIKIKNNGDIRSEKKIGQLNTSKRLDVICHQISEALK